MELANCLVSGNYLKIFSSSFIFFLRLVTKHQLNAARQLLQPLECTTATATGMGFS